MGKKYSDGKDYKVIAFFTACFSKDDQQELIKTVTVKSAEHNCKVIFFSTLTNFYFEDLDLGEKKIFDIVSVDRFDAVVLMAETFKEEDAQKRLVERATAAGVPVIAVDHHVDGCINISFDYKEAFCEIVKHMVEYHGYRNINFMAGMPDNSFSEERIDVYKRVLEENNIPFQKEKVYYGYFWEDPTVEAMKKMMEENAELPEAIICANDTMALTVCDFLSGQGIRVPEDVAVSGFDGLEAGQYHQPPLLTSIYNPAAFVESLFQLIRSADCTAEEKELKVSAYNQIQIGGSCGCKEMRAMDAAAKIIRIKSEAHEQIEYQVSLGRMVANYGEGDGMEIIQKVIPDQIKYMHYGDFWLCSEKRLLIADYPNSSIMQKKEAYNAIHFRKKEKAAAINYVEHMPVSNLVPDLEQQLEGNRPLLVVSVPSQADSNAYAVISMEPEHFWYTAYAGFIFHLRFLLDMQRTKKMLMKIYNTDALTGVLNRNGFYSMMDQVMKFSGMEELTVILLDMCNFKQINDTYGHAEGDEALKAVGSILKECITRREIAARIGGDEFLIVLFREKQKERTQEIIDAIHVKAEEFNKANLKDYKLIFSIGICSENVEDKTLDYFLREADKKMYEHKRIQKMER